ncbi:hypothetical protein GJ496_000662 [Pomphorhynchus laevis]|nr:hypothetical protein GJ496_000662 [Pomphorhynchus laevis]
MFEKLYMALISLGKSIATSKKEPDVFIAFTASRLVALENQPGVCPKGIGQVPRRIICKAIHQYTFSSIH